MANLLIISHTEHYYSDGVYYGWGATVREISHLATLFDNVVHIAPAHDVCEMNKNALPYEADNIRVRPLRPAGGRTLMSKLGILGAIPEYVRVIRDEMRRADVVHVRCPANISLVALMVLIFTRNPRKRWLKYAGNWSPVGREPVSYTIQRKLLRWGIHRGQVTVNGEWPGQPGYVHAFANPSITREELEEGRKSSEQKELSPPYKLLYVGRVETEKGADRAIMTVARLRQSGVDAELDIVGDGPSLGQFKMAASEASVDSHVRFHGWLQRTDVNKLYSNAHFMVLPSYSSEGWPKVLSEAMAYGVLPIAGDVSSIPYFLEKCGCGKSVSPTDIGAFAEAVKWYLGNESTWKDEIGKAHNAAKLFTYEAYLKAVTKLLHITNSVVKKPRGAENVVPA